MNTIDAPSLDDERDVKFLLATFSQPLNTNTNQDLTMTLISKGQTSVLLSDKCTTSPKCLFVCLVALTSKHNASASQGWLCLDKCTCCHTETEVSDNTSVHAVTLRQVSDNTSVHAATLRQVSDNTSVRAATLRQVSDNTSVCAAALRQVLITPVYVLPHWDRSFW